MKERNMSWIRELSNDMEMQTSLVSFLEDHGMAGLKDALQIYTDMHQEYICKTKNTLVKIKICDIYYMKISGHRITIFTEHGAYQKYGILNRELDLLSSYGFIKCNQSCIVALHKIKMIRDNDVILTNNVKLHISRIYAARVLTSLSSNGLSARPLQK